MKKLVLILAMVTCFIGFSQSEGEKQLNVLQQYKSAFNDTNYKTVYSLFSETYKETVALGIFEMRTNRMKKAFGNIHSILKSQKQKEGFKVYNAFFTNTKNEAFTLMVKFNDQNKIDYISFNKK